MSEFEKELEKNMKLNKVAYEKENIYSDFLVSKRDIERVFHDWQPPKPREIPVEIPQFVAGWFEEKMSVAFSELVSAYSFSGNEAIAWVYENGGIDLLCKMKLYGYTVEKENLYILKHIDMSKLYTDVSLYLAHGFCKELDHVFYKDVNVHNADECHFTQSEIDKLNIGSYEKIEVEP